MYRVWRRARAQCLNSMVTFSLAETAWVFRSWFSSKTLGLDNQTLSAPRWQTLLSINPSCPCLLQNIAEQNSMRAARDPCGSAVKIWCYSTNLMKIVANSCAATFNDGSYNMTWESKHQMSSWWFRALTNNSRHHGFSSKVVRDNSVGPSKRNLANNPVSQMSSEWSFRNPLGELKKCHHLQH